MNSKAEEYQEEFGKILNEEGYESPEGTICSYHLLVEDMIETIHQLEKRNYEQVIYLANAKRTQEFIKELKLETSNGVENND